MSSNERHSGHFLRGYTFLSRSEASPPVTIERGQGIWVYDASGRPYLEASSGMWCTSLGFSEPELIEAITRQLEKLPYYMTCVGKTVSPAEELAEKIAALAPFGNAYVHFGLSGSEANDTIIKFLHYRNNVLGETSRKKFIAFRSGYHGGTLATSSLTGLPANHQLFDLPIPGFLHVADPAYYRNGNPGETEAQFVARQIADIRSLIEAEGPETIAAFVAEPVLGSGGALVAPVAYFPALQALLDSYQIPLHADEVITGMGRTGEWFASASFGMRPASIAVAKGLTSAYQPLGALIVEEELYRALKHGSDTVTGGWFAHGTTYQGHPVSCAAGLKVIEIIERRGILAHVRRVSQHFAHRIARLADLPHVGNVRSAGLIGGVELVKDAATGRRFEPAGAFTRLVRDIAEAQYGLIFRPIGDVCAFSPPLIITREEIDELFDRFENALAAATIAFARNGKALPETAS